MTTPGDRSGQRKRRAPGTSKKAPRKAARPGSAGAELRFIETAQDPALGVFVLVRHYSDGTRREQRFTSEAIFWQQVRALGADLTADSQRLILMPPDFDPNRQP
ncbi:MAG: hypothetical protein AB7N65_11115 [Vicinamibacterales bacterium]